MASRFWSSICTPSDGSADDELASVFMIVSALSAGGPSLAAVEVAFRMLPPALATSVLNQTTTPSYWAPWISIRCGLPCLGQRLGVGEHLRPRLGRRLHQVGAVPEQLGVAVVGHRDQLPAPDRGLQRPLQRASDGRCLGRAGPRPDPAGRGELGLPGDVEAEDVHRGVVGGQSPRHLQPLLVGRVLQLVVDDGVAPVAGLAAVVGRALHRTGRVREVVELQRHRPGAGAAGAAGGQRRGGQDAAAGRGQSAARSRGRPRLARPSAPGCACVSWACDHCHRSWCLPRPDASSHLSPLPLTATLEAFPTRNKGCTLRERLLACALRNE